MEKKGNFQIVSVNREVIDGQCKSGKSMGLPCNHCSIKIITDNYDEITIHNLNWSEDFNVLRGNIIKAMEV